MKDNLKTDVPKFILEHYTMQVSEKINKFNKNYIIKIVISFIPKDPNDSYTPDKCEYRGIWSYYSDIDEISYDTATYIIKEDMPLLTYLGDEGKYWFTEFYENFAIERVNQIIEDIKLKYL